MKNFNFFLIVAVIIGIGFTACSKNNAKPYDAQKYFDLEAPILEAYADSVAEALSTELESELEAKLDKETGLWYILIEEGISDPEDEDYYKYNINSNNQIEVPRFSAEYVGRLVYSGAVFQEKGLTKELLTSVMPAWQAAFLPKLIENEDGEEKETFGLGITEHGLQKGAKIRLIVPSPLGYQDQTQPSIPANSPLDFYIEVTEVLPPSSN